MGGLSALGLSFNGRSFVDVKSHNIGRLGIDSTEEYCNNCDYDIDY